MEHSNHSELRQDGMGHADNNDGEDGMKMNALFEGYIESSFIVL